MQVVACSRGRPAAQSAVGAGDGPPVAPPELVFSVCESGPPGTRSPLTAFASSRCRKSTSRCTFSAPLPTTPRHGIGTSERAAA